VGRAALRAAGWTRRPPLHKADQLTVGRFFDGYRNSVLWHGFHISSCRTSGGGGFCSRPETAIHKCATRRRARTGVDRRPAPPLRSVRSATTVLPDCLASYRTPIRSAHYAAPRPRAVPLAAGIHSARPRLLWARDVCWLVRRKLHSWPRASGWPISTLGARTGATAHSARTNDPPNAATKLPHPRQNAPSRDSGPVVPWDDQ
jgi:hypothetical protein